MAKRAILFTGLETEIAAEEEYRSIQLLLLTRIGNAGAPIASAQKINHHVNKALRDMSALMRMQLGEMVAAAQKRGTVDDLFALYNMIADQLDAALEKPKPAGP
jgi:hypothetical protein